MATGVTRGFSDLRVAGFYLSSLLLGFLWTTTGSRFYLLLGLGSVISAAMVHGILRSIFGIGGPEENPLADSTVKQRFLVLFTKKGPANLFADNTLDIALNAASYSKLISVRRKLFFLFHGVATLIWILGAAVVLWEVGNLLQSLNLTVTLLYFVFVIWILQTFVLWRSYPSVYLLEADTESGYEIERNKSENFSVAPEQPLSWMELEDITILKILLNKRFALSTPLVSFYHYNDTITFNDEIRQLLDSTNSLTTIRYFLSLLNFWSKTETVEERIEELVEKGLVSDEGVGLYNITPLGEGYLTGGVPAEIIDEEQE